jgi:hypothetical protein
MRARKTEREPDEHILALFLLYDVFSEHRYPTAGKWKYAAEIVLQEEPVAGGVLPKVPVGVADSPQVSPEYLEHSSKVLEQCGQFCKFAGIVNLRIVQGRASSRSART